MVYALVRRLEHAMPCTETYSYVLPFQVICTHHRGAVRKQGLARARGIMMSKSIVLRACRIRICGTLPSLGCISVGKLIIRVLVYTKGNNNEQQPNNPLILI